MVRIDRLPRQPELSQQQKYLQARQEFSVALHAPRGTFDGNAVFDAYSHVWQTARFLPNRTSEFIATTLIDLAGQGAREAERRGNHGLASLMRSQIQDTEDRLAIKQGRYKVVDVRYDHGEIHGANDTRKTIYERPNGTTLSGDREDILMGSFGGVMMSPETALRIHGYPNLPVELYRALKRRDEPKL